MAQQGKYEIERLKFLSATEVRDIANTFGTPTYVYDKERISANAKFMLSLPNAYGVTVRYSIKALANRYILKFIDSLGLHFDASSQWEAQRALLAGITPTKILLTSQEFGDQVPELIKQGVLFDAGSIKQLEIYGQFFPNTEVSIRINPGFGSGLVNRLTSGGKNSSFGIWYEESNNIKNILLKYNLRVVRLHTHIGSSHNPNILLECLNRMLEFSILFGGVSTINLGGGYKTQAFKTDVYVDHYSIFEKIKQKIIEHNESYNNKIHIEVEPGTFMVAMAGSIITKITDIVSTGIDGHEFLKIDSGLTEIIRPSYYGAPHPLVVVPKNGDAIDSIKKYCVVGHCCIAGDVLTTELGNAEVLQPQLLQEANIDDYLVIERAGGYCSSMSLKNFNSYPEAVEVIRLVEGDYKIVRKRQTINQICQNEIVE